MDTLRQAYAKTIQDELQPLNRRQNEVKLQTMQLQDNLAIAMQTRTTAVSLLAQPRDEKPGGKHATRDAGELDIVIAEGDRITLIEKQLEVMEQVRRLMGRQIEQRKGYASLIPKIANIRKRADLWVLRLNSRPADYIQDRVPQLLRYHSDIEAACQDLIGGLQIYSIDTAALERAIEKYLAEMQGEHSHITGVDDYDTGNSSTIRSGESSGAGSEATAA